MVVLLCIYMYPAPIALVAFGEFKTSADGKIRDVNGYPGSSDPN